MPKQCNHEGCSYNVFSNGYCRAHQNSRTDSKWGEALERNKALSQSSFSSVGKTSAKPRKSLKTSKITYKRKPTGELNLFLKIYADRKGICEITGKQLAFDVSCFMHILGKGSYPSLRLMEENIMMVDKAIHDLYDNQARDKLLVKYPTANVIYERKEKLKFNYYNK